MERNTRLQKFLSECGVASRRKSEEYILQGRVKVNGRPVSLGDKVNPTHDIVTLDGERVVYDRKKKYTYIILNKPRGYVTTTHDEMGRKCVMELLGGVSARVYPVGRLDRNSEGLLLLTDDGELANRIMHPSGHIAKVYRVTVRPDITDEQAAQLASGVEIDGKKTLPATVRVLVKEENRVVLEIAIREGRNRQIRKMCEAVGLEVARLRRTAIGPIKLGMLQPGKYRELAPAEVAMLRGALAAGSPQERG